MISLHSTWTSLTQLHGAIRLCRNCNAQQTNGYSLIWTMIASLARWRRIESPFLLCLFYYFPLLRSHNTISTPRDAFFLFVYKCSSTFGGLYICSNRPREREKKYADAYSYFFVQLSSNRLSQYELIGRRFRYTRLHWTTVLLVAVDENRCTDNRCELVFSDSNFTMSRNFRNFH